MSGEQAYLSYLEQKLSKGKQRPGGYGRKLEPAQAASPRSGRIEETLMQRHRQSQSRLALLKAQFQAQELSEMRASPAINPPSKRSNQSNPGNGNRKSEVENREKEGNREESKTGNAVVELKCHVSLTEGTISPVCPATKQDSAPSTSIDQLRSQARAKYSTQLEPPPDILEMSVLNRQSYFLERRDQRLQEQRQKQVFDEVKDCTFRPALTPRRSVSAQKSDRGSRSVSADRRKSGYYERYLYTKALKTQGMSQTNVMKPTSSREESRHQQRSVVYQPLSPVGVKVGFRSGLNLNEFLNHARPMVNYRNVDMQKARHIPRSTLRTSLV